MKTLGSILTQECLQGVFPKRNLHVTNISKEELLEVVKEIVQTDGQEIFRPEAVERQVDILSRWLRGDSEFSTKTTVFLWGNVGTGKTTLLRALKKVLEQKNKVVHLFLAAELSDWAAVDAEKFRQEKTAAFLAIDDLGEEPEKVMNYGTPIYPIRTLLEERYSLLSPTFISSNISPEQVGERYGERVADRLGQIAFSIKFPGESLRSWSCFY